MKRTRNTGHMTDCFHGHYNEVKPGDTIRFEYGVGCGDDTGKAYGKRETRWGRQIRVKMADGRFEYVSGLTEIGIGAYWTPDSPLREKAGTTK